MPLFGRKGRARHGLLTAAISAGTGRHDVTPEAELQFAIYPWAYGTMAPMYDITATAGQYQARDIAGNSPDIAAPALEELVEQMAVQPGGSQAMLRWVRRLQDLPAAPIG